MFSLKEHIEKAKKKGLTKEELTLVLLQKGYSEKEIEEALSSGKEAKEETIPLGEKIKGLFQPATFFQSFREKTITKSFFMYFLSLLIVSVSYSVFSFALLGFFSGPFFSSFTLIFPLVAGIIGLGIYSGIAHLTVMLIKHEGNFKDTHNVIAYSLVPAIIISIIPYFGWISIIYSIVLMTYGLSHYHNISKGKALMAVLIPIILLLGFIGFWVVSFLAVFENFLRL